MSSDSIIVELEKRDTLGKGLAKVRDAGKVPAVIHNHGKDSIHVQGDYTVLSKMYAAAGKSNPVEIKVGKDDFLTLVREVDVEPTKQRMRHIVFQAIKRGEKVQAEVPVVLEGDVPAERNSLMVITSLDHVEIEALPNKLVNELTVSATTLVEVGDRLTVADINVPDGVTILNEPDQGIAHVEMPRDQVAEADAAAAELAADAEGTGDEPDQVGSEDSADEEDEKSESEEAKE